MNSRPPGFSALAAALDHAGADLRLGRPAAMEGRIHDDGVIAPLDRLAQQIDPEEARLDSRVWPILPFAASSEAKSAS